MSTEAPQKKRKSRGRSPVEIPLSEKRWLTPDEAAAYLGVSIRKLCKNRERREGPAFSVLGYRTVRYDRAELDRWAEAQRVSPDDEL